MLLNSHWHSLALFNDHQCHFVLLSFGSKVLNSHQYSVAYIVTLILYSVLLTPSHLLSDYPLGQHSWIPVCGSLAGLPLHNFIPHLIPHLQFPSIPLGFLQQQYVFWSLEASMSVWENVECKLSSVNIRRVSDPWRVFRPAFGVTVISDARYSSTIWVIVTSWGICWHAGENVVCI